jgi:hypothetical protein
VEDNLRQQQEREEKQRKFKDEREEKGRKENERKANGDANADGHHVCNNGDSLHFKHRPNVFTDAAAKQHEY